MRGEERGERRDGPKERKRRKREREGGRGVVCSVPVDSLGCGRNNVEC
jgi:hypothetical protein